MTGVSTSLLRLLQLSSPSLPVGAYAYSQGLESAVELGWVRDEASLFEWVEEQLVHAFGVVDLPIFVRAHRAASRGDVADLRRWSRRLIACRETRELVEDDRDRGRALARLLTDLGHEDVRSWISDPDVAFAPMAAIASVHWGIHLAPALQAHAWGWLENQVLAGVKLVPLGQVAGQRLLLHLTRRVPALCEQVRRSGDDEIGGTLPVVALASGLHETQYSRLYRS